MQSVDLSNTQIFDSTASQSPPKPHIVQGSVEFNILYIIICNITFNIYIIQ